MALSTAKKVRFLQEYISEWAEKLVAIHRENISGIRVDKKWSGGRRKLLYSIVFQVKNKIDESNLEESQVIPPYFDILFPDGIERRIKTDIHETGEFQFQSYIAGKVVSTHSYEFGSMGLFVNDYFNNTYALTNYHVAAKTLMDSGQFFYQREATDTTPDVTITPATGTVLNGIFDRGAINTDVDVAFILVTRTPETVNLLPDGSSLNGSWDINKVINSGKGAAVKIFSLFDQNNSTIQNPSVAINNPSCNIVITGLIQLSGVVSRPGDSGGLATDSLNSVIGIVVGADKFSTYLVPFYKIANFTKCYPI